MADRSILILCASLAILLYIIFYLPSIASDVEKKTQTKVSSDTAQESRLQETMKKFVKSIGDIEARLLGLERKMDGVSKVKESVPVVHMPVSHQEHDASNEDSATGEIKQGENCFDSAEHEVGGEVEVMACHKKGRNQFFEVKDGMIHHKEMCLSVRKPKLGAVVILEGCDQDDLLKEWRYHDKIFQAGESGFCITSKGSGAITLEQCNADDTSQQWNI